MKRYNQGFGKFGPMEQCKDGEWIRYEYYEKLHKKYSNALNKIEILHKVNNVLHEDAIDTVGGINEMVKEEADFYRFISAVSLAGNAGFIISEIINKFFL